MTRGAEVDELLRLGNLVAQELVRDPQHAFAIAQTAVSITETLSHDAFPLPVIAQLSAYAWKDLGQALQYLGRASDALIALDRAELAASEWIALAHDRAVVRLARAIVLQELGRTDESAATLAECREVFRDRGDEKRLHFCRIAEAVLLQRSGKQAAARKAYLQLLAEDGLDADAAASLQKLIGSLTPGGTALVRKSAAERTP